MMKTDWDSYYKKPFVTALGTRKITQRVLTGLMREFAGASRHMTIAELGGADSCFFDIVKSRIGFSRYCVVDNNRQGLDQFRKRVGDDTVVFMNRDVLLMRDEAEKYDLVFSVGLVEHFDVGGTAQAIAAHFGMLKENGIGIITFPTPTFLYRATRRIAEILGLWKFPDERPLRFDEVKNEVKRSGVILHESIIWPIILTQGVVVFKKILASKPYSVGR